METAIQMNEPIKNSYKYKEEYLRVSCAACKIKYRITDGGHEFATDSAGYDFVFKFI